jgi:hypothetical protein
LSVNVLLHLHPYSTEYSSPIPITNLLANGRIQNVFSERVILLFRCDRVAKILLQVEPTLLDVSLAAVRSIDVD